MNVEGLHTSISVSDMCGMTIYSVTQIYVFKGYKTAPHPSHPISHSHRCQRAIPLYVCERERLIKGARYPSYPEEMV